MYIFLFVYCNAFTYDCHRNKWIYNNVIIIVCGGWQSTKRQQHIIHNPYRKRYQHYAVISAHFNLSTYKKQKVQVKKPEETEMEIHTGTSTCCAYFCTPDARKTYNHVSVSLTYQSFSASSWIHKRVQRLSEKHFYYFCCCCCWEAFAVP